MTRLVWLDALRLTASVSMVGLHSTADSYGQPFVDYSVQERIGPLIIRAVIYTARTELFLLISIFLLLMALDRRPKGYGETIIEQTRRLLVPFIFWVVFFAFYNLLKASEFGYSDSILFELSDWRSWVGYFFLGDVKYHMHFIPTLFGLVLMYPLYGIAKKYTWLGFIVLGCLLVKHMTDVFLWATIADAPNFDYILRGVKILTYTGYGFVAASLLGLFEKTRGGVGLEKWLPLVLIFGAILFSIKLVATYRTAVEGAWQYNYVAAYWADFLMPIILFLLALVLSQRSWPTIFSRLAPYSFGIYLCHPIFLDLTEILIRDVAISPTIQVLIKIGLTLLATSAFVFCLSRTTTMAWTVGLGRFPTKINFPKNTSKSGEKVC